MAGAQTSLTLQDRMTGPLQKIIKAMDATIRVMEQMNEAANLDPAGIEKAQKAIENANSAMNRYTAEAKQGIGGNTTAQAGLNNEIRAGTSDMKGFAVAILSAVGAYKVFNAAKGFLKDILGQGVEFHAFKQASEAAFTTFLGDAEKAKAYMDDMYAFALTTPFAYPDLLESSRNLIAFGMSAENTFPVMQAIGDAVAAIGGGNAELQSMADIFGMIQVQGKLTMMEVNRLGKHGVNSIAMLADAAGVSGDEIKKQISAGAIDAGTAIETLVAGIDKQFGGSMEKLKGTWAGAIDSMKSSVRNAGAAMMEPFMKFEGPLVKLVQNITNQIKKIPQYIGPAIAAFIPLIDALNEALNADAFDEFFTIVGAGLTALAWIVSGLGIAVLEVAQFFSTHWSVIEPILVPIGTALAVITGILIAKYAWLGLVRVATLAWATAQWIVNAAYLANPIGLTILIIVSIISLVIYAMMRWEEESAAVFGAIVGGLYWLGAGVYNVLMFIANMSLAVAEFFVDSWNQAVFTVLMIWFSLNYIVRLVFDAIGNGTIAVAEFFVNIWNQALYMVQMGWIALNIMVRLVFDAIGNAAIAVAEFFVNTWNQALYMVQMGWIALNIMVRLILDAIGNAALGAAEWFMNAWNGAVFGVQSAFHSMGTFIGSVMSGVASGTVGVVNSALGAISTLINGATSGINSLIGMINNIPGVNISTIGAVDLKLGAGISNFAANIGKSLAAPVKAANVSLGKMNTAGNYASNITAPSAPVKANFGKFDSAGAYAGDLTAPTAPVKANFGKYESAGDYLNSGALPDIPGKADFGRFDYESLGDAFAEGQKIGSDASKTTSNALNGVMDKVTGLASDLKASLTPGEIPDLGYDPSNGAPTGTGTPPGGKSPSGTKSPTGTGSGAKGKNPTGGKLDSIGKIDSDISIADEDLQMLRELSDIKSIQNFVTLTPTVSFKDVVVREEADIPKITAAIEKVMKDDIARSAEGVYT